MAGCAGPETARRLCLLLLLTLPGLLVPACRAELHHGLSEEEATELVGALQAQRVDAAKEREGREQTWLVDVPAGEAARAWQVLHAAGLPRRRPVDFQQTFGEPGLIPSPTEDQVRLQQALAGELERSLMAMNGVLDARVHLVVPAPEGLRRNGQQPVASGAAVLLVHRPAAAAGVDLEAVRRLVAGAVAGLAPDDVEIVTTTRGAIDPAPGGPELVQVGPFQVARGSAGMLRAVLGGLGGLVLLTSGLLVWMLWRRRRSTGAA